MRITERKLRSIIRSVIRESSQDYRLSVDFGMKVERMIDEVKSGFVENCRNYKWAVNHLDDYTVDDFLRKYLKDVIHLNGEAVARDMFNPQGNYDKVMQAFKRYLGLPSGRFV